MSSSGVSFDHPALLALLALALLPLRRASVQALSFPQLAWLPRDRRGPWLERSMRWLAAFAVGSIVLGLAGPHREQSSVARSARGAEVAIVLDRSASMDAVIRRPGQQSGGELSAGQTKSHAVREALEQWVRTRPDDRYSVTLFSTAPLPVLPFTGDTQAVLAALHAAGVGRGLTDTRMGPALLRALQAFEDRPYAGARVLLLVSDGGAELDEATRERLRAGFAAQHVALHFLFIRGGPSSPDLGAAPSAQPAPGEPAELALHRFFGSLSSPYVVYQADAPESIDAAIAEIARRQDQPLTVQERVPRIDWHAHCFALALACCVALALLARHQIRDWG